MCYTHKAHSTSVHKQSTHIIHTSLRSALRTGISYERVGEVGSSILLSVTGSLLVLVTTLVAGGGFFVTGFFSSIFLPTRAGFLLPERDRV